MTEMKAHILWLASAWPNRLSPFNGDFVQRHAQAASAFVPIHVITVVRDVQGMVTRSVHKEVKHRGDLTETVIYYYCPDRFGTVIGKIRSAILYRKYLREAVREHMEQQGLPRCVHVHWGMKAGMEAMRIKRKWGVPYFVTEHWTGFLPEAADNFSQLPPVIRNTWKRILYGSAGCIAVSETLAAALRKRFPGLPVSVIPNVVDTSVFYPRKASVVPHRFIHISGMDDFKDPASLFKAFRAVLNTVPDAELHIYGTASPQMKELADRTGITPAVSFHAEVPQPELADAMVTAAALILYSRYETFGCVIIEANACGVPVIVSDLPVFRESVEQGVNGLLAAPGDPAALAAAMLQMIRERERFNTQVIAQRTIQAYAYPVVGEQLATLYSNTGRS